MQPSQTTGTAKGSGRVRPAGTRDGGAASVGRFSACLSDERAPPYSLNYSRAGGWGGFVVQSLPPVGGGALRTETREVISGICPNQPRSVHHLSRNQARP